VKAKQIYFINRLTFFSNLLFIYWPNSNCFSKWIFFCLYPFRTFERSEFLALEFVFLNFTFHYLYFSIADLVYLFTEKLSCFCFSTHWDVSVKARVIEFVFVNLRFIFEVAGQIASNFVFFCSCRFNTY
jgi:hypothetical protein